MSYVSGTVVVAFGIYLIGLAMVIAFRPQIAKRYLSWFASSQRAHVVEQAVRLVLGTAIVVFSPSMWFGELFQMLGWLIIGTSVGLLMLPWRWHARFAEWAVPWAIRHLRAFGVGAFGLGLFVLYGVSRGF